MTESLTKEMNTLDTLGKYKKSVIILMYLAIGLVCLPKCWAYYGKVLDVPEGDLLVIDSDGASQKIRLYGIACPAAGQPFHDKAKFLAKHLSLKKGVEVTPVFRDSEGIENALVRIEGVSDYLNNQLIGYGLAWVKPCDSKSRLCEQWKKQEGFAQMNFIGLWAQPPVIAPWDWKKFQRMQIYEKSMKSRESQQ